MKFDNRPIKPQITMYWSRRPGSYVDVSTGSDDVYQWTRRLTVTEWYDTLLEVIWSMCGQLGSIKDSCVIPSPEICTIIQLSHSFRAVDNDCGTIGPNGDISIVYKHAQVVPDYDEIVVACNGGYGVIKVLGLIGEL